MLTNTAKGKTVSELNISWKFELWKCTIKSVSEIFPCVQEHCCSVASPSQLPPLLHPNLAISSMSGNLERTASKTTSRPQGSPAIVQSATDGKNSLVERCEVRSTHANIAQDEPPCPDVQSFARNTSGFLAMSGGYVTPPLTFRQARSSSDQGFSSLIGDQPSPCPTGYRPKESSLEEPTGFGQEGRVIFQNASDYTVSYWVLQEDKLTKTAIREKVVTSADIELSLNTRVDFTARANVSREATVAMDISPGPYVLMADHRMEARQQTNPTEVPFPKNCKALRVYAFSRNHNGTWKRYMDKLLSMPGKKKKFTITGLDSSINLYN